MGTKALEADLNDAAGLLLEIEEPGEVLHRRHRRLLEVDVSPGDEGSASQMEVLAERRRDHHDVDRAGSVQCLGQVGVQVGAIDGRRVQDYTRIDGCDQLDDTLIGKTTDPIGVHLSEPTNSDQNDTSGAGTRWGTRKRFHKGTR